MTVVAAAKIDDESAAAGAAVAAALVVEALHGFAHSGYEIVHTHEIHHLPSVVGKVAFRRGRKSTIRQRRGHFRQCIQAKGRN